MLYHWLRVLDSDNGTLSDFSLDNQNESKTMPFDLVTTEDYIYIGKHFPFNNFWMQVDTVNSVTATLKLEYWDATNEAWRETKDNLDGTADSGVPLAQSGVIQFSPDSDYGWLITSDTTSGQFPIELSTVTIYNMYWLRVSYDATLTPGTLIKRIAYAFTSHQQIDNIDTTINQYLDSFESGKTNWDDQIVTASMQVVRDLKRKGLIQDQGQVLRLDDVSIPTDYMTLALIYYNLGGDYADKLEDARLQYKELINLERYTFDTDRNAFVSRSEITNRSARMVR